MEGIIFALIIFGVVIGIIYVVFLLFRHLLIKTLKIDTVLEELTLVKKQNQQMQSDLLTINSNIKKTQQSVQNVKYDIKLDKAHDR